MIKKVIVLAALGAGGLYAAGRWALGKQPGGCQGCSTETYVKAGWAVVATKITSLGKGGE